MSSRNSAEFTTVRSEGGLLPPDLLRRIVNLDPELGGFGPSDYRLAANEPVREAMARAWKKARDYWAAFRSATSDLQPGESDLQPTRQQWLLPLLRDLGYRALTYQAAAETVGERRYPISYHSGPVPLHLVGCRQSLDRAVSAPGGAARSSPHALLQEYLNRSDRQYGIVSNGLTLRLLRDNASLTRQAFLEFNLEAMFEGGVYADFVLLYLALHRTRLPAPEAEASPCWLERWRENAATRGTRALGELRRGVETAITALGSGFLAHPANDALRQQLQSGEISVADYYQQLLRLIYRLLFLFVAEERDLIYPSEPPQTPPATPGDPARSAAPTPAPLALNQQRYVENYGVTRLRHLASRYRTDERHDDLWRGLQITFQLVAGVRSGLDFPAIGGGLFNSDSCRALDGARLANSALAQAILHLSYVKVDRVTRWISYRDIDAEELGGVYEGLLERQPSLRAHPGYPHFELIGSSQRKQTGSYYTPSALVDELIKSALDPVIAERLAGQRRPSERRAALRGITVCDPACGSGHFLLAAARRLARELALIDSGGDEPSPEQQRAALREVIGHCIYGVDLNPLAVDLCKLALWLEGHDPGRGLTFLDSHVRCGNSLVGVFALGALKDGIPDEAYAAIADDEKSTASAIKRRNRVEHKGQSSAFAAGLETRLTASFHQLADDFASLDALEERSVADEQAKREIYQSLLASGDWWDQKTACDLWTSAFFAPLRQDHALVPTTDTLRQFLARPRATSAAVTGFAVGLSAAHRFFHWPLEFPEVIARGGFDCVLGNPPWEKVEFDEIEFFQEREPAIASLPGARRKSAIERLKDLDRPLWDAYSDSFRNIAALTKFCKSSERFPATGAGRVNLYALFAELNRELANPRGRSGVIVPTGIATDDSTKRFFQSIAERRSLATLFDFENRGVFFPAVHASYKFSLLTLSAAPVPRGDLAFFLTAVEQIRDDRRRFQLSAEDFALLNPNTRTCPVFRTSVDAELTKAIYRRVPVLIDEASNRNPWRAEFMQGLFNMTSDSHLFRDAPGPGLVPLYEAKLFHQYNHRWATFDGKDARDATPAELADPAWRIRPRYWVESTEVEARLQGRWGRRWLLAHRRICRATDERTMIADVLPRAGVPDGGTLLLPASAITPARVAALAANLDAFVVDYATRQKIGGVHLDYHHLRQLPVLPPTAYTEDDLAFIVPRVLELTYTAWDLKPFAEDLGYTGPPFRWDAERRAILRAELDAYYAALYGLTRDELRYLLDPADVYGPDFPGETFRVLKERELRAHGEYRTRRLTLEAWDRLGLAPRQRDGRYPAEPTAPNPGRENGKRPRGRAALNDRSPAPSIWPRPPAPLPGLTAGVQASFEEVEET